MTELRYAPPTYHDYWNATREIQGMFSFSDMPDALEAYFLTSLPESAQTLIDNFGRIVATAYSVESAQLERAVRIGATASTLLVSGAYQPEEMSPTDIAINSVKVPLVGTSSVTEDSAADRITTDCVQGLSIAGEDTKAWLNWISMAAIPEVATQRAARLACGFVLWLADQEFAALIHGPRVQELDRLVNSPHTQSDWERLLSAATEEGYDD